MLIVNDGEESGIANFGIFPHSLENGLNEGFAFAHVVVGMLITGGEGTMETVGRGVCETRLEEAVGGKVIVVAGGNEVVNEGTEEILVAGEAVEGGGHGGIVVVDDGVELVFGEALVDGGGEVAPVDAHVHAADGGGGVHEGAIGEGGSRDGGKPAVKDAELLGQGGEYREGLGGETFHDAVGVFGISGFVFVAADETVHDGIFADCGGGVAVELGEDVETGVAWVGGEVTGETRVIGNRGGAAGGVAVAFGAFEAVDGPLRGLRETQHVIEGTVFHHEDDDVFEIVESGRHT